jgi:hypothetical protein
MAASPSRGNPKIREKNPDGNPTLLSSLGFPLRKENIHPRTPDIGG